MRSSSPHHIPQHQLYEKLNSYGIILVISYLILAFILQFSHVYPFSLWPAITIGVIAIVWLFGCTLFVKWDRTLQISKGAFFIQAILLSLLVHFTGGLQSSFPIIHIANIAAATWVLGRKGGLATAITGLVTLALVWTMESTGFWPAPEIWGQGVSRSPILIMSIKFIIIAVPLLLSVMAVSGALDERALRQHQIDKFKQRTENHLNALRQTQYQAKLESSRLAAILNSTHEGMLLYDADGKLVFSNPMVDTLLTPRLPAFRGDISETTYSGSHTRILRPEIKATRKEPSSVTHREFTLNTVPARYLAIDSYPVNQKDKNLVGRLILVRDITDQKELETSREEWIQMLVHDLRSPLTNVIGYLELVDEMVQEEKDLPGIANGVKNARSSSTKLLHMISSLLDIYKIRAGKASIELCPISLPHLAAAALKENALAARMVAIELELDVAPHLPQIVGDREKLYRVLINLLDNAIKFTPDGGTITIHMEAVGTAVNVSIVDSGPGIPEAHQHAIFERFAQIPGSFARRQGSGLGLAFCKLVVEMHGGSIWVDAPSEKGSRFTFSLPLSAQPLEELEVTT